MEKVRYTVNLCIIFLLLLTVAVHRDGKILGTPVREVIERETPKEEVPVEMILEDGTRVLNSTSIAEDISGFGGPTPLKIHLKADTIVRIELLANNETPDFLAAAVEGNPLDRWIGLSPTEVLSHKVDAVSGATLTSSAINQTIRRTAGFVARESAVATTGSLFSIKSLIGLLVIGLGVAFTFVKVKSKHFRTFHLILNVLVLGFWCGSFLSLSLLVNWLSNGVHLSVALLPFVLLVVAIAAPFFGKKANYCTFHCPMGSLQELIGKSRKTKINLSPKLVNRLGMVRETILAGLLFLMWIGVGFELLDYEAFSLFLPSSASPVVLILGLVVLLLSPFINRPYCRFVCPTGALLKFYQQPSKTARK